MGDLLDDCLGFDLDLLWNSPEKIALHKICTSGTDLVSQTIRKSPTYKNYISGNRGSGNPVILEIDVLKLCCEIFFYSLVQCAVQPVPNAIKGYYIMPPQKSHAPISGTPI